MHDVGLAKLKEAPDRTISGSMAGGPGKNLPQVSGP